MAVAQTVPTAEDSRQSTSLMTRIGVILAELNQPIEAMNTFDLCAIVTLVLLFLYAGTHWYLTIPSRAICLCAIFIPKLRHSRHLWYAVLALLIAANYYDRYLIDNHKYLMTYWVLAVFLASTRDDAGERDRVISFNGRILLGLCFLFAVIAKLLSADYLNGGFFRHTLLLDSRFSSFTSLVGGVDSVALSEVKASAHDLRSAYLLNVDVSQAKLFASRRFSLLVWFMTFWTISIESALAVVFLWPKHKKFVEWGRRYLLWIFLITTYSVALVSGFAWTLAVMGLAQLPKTHARFRIVYIFLVAVVLQFYEIHYTNFLQNVVNYMRSSSK
jgi:hypothetical protein